MELELPLLEEAPVLDFEELPELVDLLELLLELVDLLELLLELVDLLELLELADLLELLDLLALLLEELDPLCPGVEFLYRSFSDEVLYLA